MSIVVDQSAQPVRLPDRFRVAVPSGIKQYRGLEGAWTGPGGGQV